MIDNVYDLITQNMEGRYAGRVAFRWYDAAADAVRVRTYGEYAQDIRRAVTYFRQTVPDLRGKRICLLSKNCYEYAVNTFGVLMAGGVLVTLNQKKTWDELKYELELVEPAAILNDGVDYGYRAELEAACGPLLRPMDGYAACAPGELVRSIDPNALMVLMFTSGTTGRSKGVMLAERNFFTVMQLHTTIANHMWAFKNDPNILLSQFTVLPMFHLGAFICLFSWAMLGYALNLCSDVRDFYRDLQKLPSDAVAVTPVLLQSIHRDVMRGRTERLGGVWVPICSSAMFAPEVLLDMVRHGMLMIQTYGMTETCGDGLVNFAQDPEHIGAIGKPDSHCEYKLDHGEICIRGGSVMLGYYKDPEATAEMIDPEGWLHTGDLAREDEQGYYYIVGRKKNVIILDSGENVSPEELEKLLGRCEAVKECLVKEKNKKICAVVFCEETRRQEVQDFITALNRTQPMYKRITAVEFCSESLPHNAAGKLERK